MSTTPQTRIAEDDTVLLDGGRARFVVVGIDADGYTISRTYRVDRCTRRTTTTTVHGDRLTLVRAGNRDADIADAMIAEIDACRALRAGTITKAEYDVVRANMLRVLA